MRGRKYFSTGLLALGLAGGSAFAADDARTQLLDMANTLAAAKQFSVTIHMRYDVVQASGQKIQFSEIRKVRLSRPEHLRVDARQSDGDSGGLIFDGKTLTQFSEPENVYSQISLPGDVDAAVRYAVSRLNIRVPLARMLVTSLPQEIQKLSNAVDFIEKDTLGAAPTSHIAGRTDNVDYQFWIMKNRLPVRAVLTYRDAPGQPQFEADFSDWNLAPKLSDTTFSFTPPQGAEKIPLLIPLAPTNVTDNREGAAK